MRSVPKAIAAAAVLAVTLGALVAAPRILRPQASGVPATYIIALNAGAATCGSDEPLPAAVATGYTGTEALFVDDTYVVRLLDDHGDRVAPAGPVEEPGPPPGDHYVVDVDGRLQHVEPVRALRPGDATASVLPDALSRYRPIEPGTYAVQAHWHVTVYDPDELIDRSDEELSADLWVPPGEVVERVRTVSNSLQITVQ